MRQITQDAVEAFTNGYTFKRDNTKVEVFIDRVILRLHGHTIAKRMFNREDVQIRDAGWQTATTKEICNDKSKSNKRDMARRRDFS